MTYDPDRFVAFDVETHLIQPGLAAPPIVCGAFYDGQDARLLLRDGALDLLEDVLDSSAVIVGANLPYDFACACAARPQMIDLVFRAYQEERVFDVLLAEQLHAIAEGTLGFHPLTREPLGERYSLDVVVDLVLGRKDVKSNDTWRLRYALLEDIPVDQWPEDARQYCLDDVRNPHEVALAQLTRNRNLHDLPAQVYTAWCLQLGAVWGFAVDAERVRELEDRVNRDYDRDVDRFKELGFKRPDGSANTKVLKRLVAVAYGAAGECAACEGTGEAISEKTGNPVQCRACQATGFDSLGRTPRTEKGAVQTSRDALTESGDDDLIRYAEFESSAKLRNVYVPFLKQGIDRPLTLSANTMLANGRASYNGVIQLMPRDAGVRECLRARDGYLLSSTDYGGLELVTHGQSCLWIVGWSRLADQIRREGAGSVHAALGAEIAGVPYDEFLRRMKAEPFLKACRQAAKPVNFGAPGGIGPAKIVLQQRKQGPDTTAADGTVYKGLRFCVLLGAPRCGEEMITDWRGRDLPGPMCARCIEVADRIRKAWFKRFPENNDYFRHVTKITDQGGDIVQHVSRRIRGGAGFTDGANSYFSGLAADGAKLALRRAQTECFDRRSVLYGSRIVLFAHDELVGEHPEGVASDAAKRVSEIMVSAMREFTPDLPVEAPPALMRRYIKGAEPKFNERGELIPWD